MRRERCGIKYGDWRNRPAYLGACSVVGQTNCSANRSTDVDRAIGGYLYGVPQEASTLHGNMQEIDYPNP